MGTNSDRPFGCYTLSMLRELRARAAAEMARQKEHIALIDREITQRYRSDFAARYAAEGKVSGETTIERDGIALVGEISKTVKWDSPALMKIAGSMDWEQVQKLFKIEFSVPEARYRALEAANPDLFAQITAARTVRFSDLKVRFKD